MNPSNKLKDKSKTEAVVFSLFETGLGIARSLGQKGVKVIGVDYKKDIAWYSRYVKSLICPHPINEKERFLGWIKQNFGGSRRKIPAFLGSDDFLSAFSIHRSVLSEFFLFNLVDSETLKNITNKYSQFMLAEAAGIHLPKTKVLSNRNDIDLVSLNDLRFPVFIKGLEVNSWRQVMGGTIKGYPVESLDVLRLRAIELLEKNVPIIIQEIIPGPDTNHFKYNAYIGLDGRTKAEFTLKKIRQNPIRFGVGAVVESIHDNDLLAEGRKLFKGINFTGIGSAEFKRDTQDGKLKLIEINPRYWQQNYLSTACGVNFPYINFCDLKGILCEHNPGFKKGVKWVNRYMDLDSFLKYRKAGELTYLSWRKSLRGPKVYSDFTWDDPLPVFYEIGFGAKLVRAPLFLIKRL